MSKDQVSAEAVIQAVLHRITIGHYAPGDRLPPVRKLAEELGSNRNTVNKAYQMLSEMGLIEFSDIRRQGYSVKESRRAGAKSKDELLDYFYQQAADIIWQGMAAGMTPEEMLNQTRKAVNDVFSNSVVNMIFYECNDYDTTEMGEQLNQVLDTAVEFKNLSHFYKNPASVLKKYDLIITTYHHLAEITTAIKEQGFPAGKVVGIDTRLSADSMLQIARFPNNRIGVVTTNQNTAHMIKHILFGYHPEWEVEAISREEQDDSGVKEMAQNCDHLVVTLTCAEEVTALTGRSPDVIATFQIDEQSIAFLNGRIHQIRMEKIQALQSSILKLK
jgi:DNA-binding transcriptional regulator YhcF (GntR family)